MISVGSWEMCAEELQVFSSSEEKHKNRVDTLKLCLLTDTSVKH